MKKPRKRYNSEEEIIAAIDKCKTVATDKLIKADGIEQWIEQIKKDAKKAAECAEQIKWERCKIRRLRKQANNLIEKRVKLLGRKLAEFRTEIIPSVTTDRSVMA